MLLIATTFSKIFQASLALFLLTLLLRSNCIAEPFDTIDSHEDSSSIGEVVVTANRLEESVENIPASVTVITKEDIEKKQAITIDELLRDVPGMRIARFGTIGEESFPAMRGADRRHLLVMIDGIVVNPSYDDVFNFADYHVDNIERIEIIRGSYSASYGSDAIGGVINIITQKPKDTPDFSFFSEGGSFFTFREIISANNRIKNLKFIFSASRTDSQGNFDRDQYENNTFSANFIYGFSGDSALNFISRFIDSKKEIAIEITPTLDTLEPHVIFDQNAEIIRKTSINSLCYRKTISDSWDFSLTGSYFRLHDIENDDVEEGTPSPFAFFKSNTISERYTLETQHNFYIRRMDTITTGIVYEREDVISNNSTNLTPLLPSHETIDKHKTNLAYYLQNIFNWDDRWIFIAGGRIDRYSNFGSIFSPRISSSYLIEATKTKFKGSYGLGFHAPSFDQQYSIPLGNTDLQPEKSKSFEIGFDQPIYGNFLKLGATYFSIDFTDKITIDFTKLKYVNMEKSKSGGVELYLKFAPINELVFNLNYTYTDTKNKETNKEFAGIPRNTLNFNMDYMINKKFNVNMGINFVGSQYIDADIIGLNGKPLGNRNPSYYKVDFAASYILLENLNSPRSLTLYGNIQNLLNRDYTEVVGAPSPGINFLAGLKATF